MQQDLPQVSNDEFLREAFKNAGPNEQVWVLSKNVVDDNNWKGGALGATAPTGPVNNYTSPATVRVGTERKDRNFAAAHLIVLDDANLDSLPLPPSYVIQTSPGSHQAGYFLTPPEDSIERVSSLMSVLSAKDNTLCDTSGNNPVRVIRLPQGRNTKKDAEVAMLEWNPERRYSFGEIDLMLRKAIQGDSTDLQPDDFKSNQELFDDHLKAIVKGVDLHDSINRVAARLIANGSEPRDVVKMLQAIMHGSEVKKTDRERWQVRYDDIDRAVESALVKYGPDSVVTDETTQLNTEGYGFKEVDEVEWVIEGFISTGITIIAGAPGVGKTSKIIALAQLAAHLCNPMEPLRPVLRRRVIYVTEDALQIKRAMYGHNILGGLEIPEEEYHRWLEIKNAARLSSKDLEREVRSMVRANTTIGPNGYKIRPLIVLDTSNATLDMEDENSNSEAGAFVSRLKRAAAGSPLWLVAHTSKAMGRADSKGLSARGASAFEGDANAVAYVFQEDDVPEYRFMRLGKHRYESEVEELRFRTSVHEHELTTSWGTRQTIKIRVAHPEQSWAASREREVEKGRRERAEGKADELAQRITEDIISLLQQGPTSKGTIEDQIIGGRSKIREVLQAMETDGLITIKVGRSNAHWIELASDIE
jgi:AAA domain